MIENRERKKRKEIEKRKDTKERKIYIM